MRTGMLHLTREEVNLLRLNYRAWRTEVEDKLTQHKLTYHQAATAIEPTSMFHHFTADEYAFLAASEFHLINTHATTMVALRYDHIDWLDHYFDQFIEADAAARMAVVGTRRQ